MIAVGTYVLLGLVGLPIFAAGGGIMYVVRPSFGYLIGFVAAAFLCGKVAEVLKASSFAKFLPACFSGLVICYAIGLVYKYAMLNLYVGEKTAFVMVIADCFPLDLPGDVLLSVLAAITAVKLRPAVRRMLEQN